MNAARFGRLAVFGATVALAVPVVAQANEVTKWNAIAVNTMLAPTQPGVTSGAPAAGVLTAMVQGAVYGAVNATDRHGQPYLVMRSFPKASPDAAAATAAFRVLDALFPAQHAAFQAQYDMSLAGLPPGMATQSGIEVGTMAADAMLAQGHDGRQAMPCVFGGGPGVWQPLPGPTPGPFLCDPTPWAGNAVPVIVQSSSSLRTAAPYAL